MKNKGQLSIEKNITKYGKTKPTHKSIVTDAFSASQAFFKANYFLEVTVLGKYKNILEISVLSEYEKSFRNFCFW